MVLYAAFVSIVIIFLLVAAGPLELALLKRYGIDLVSSLPNIAAAPVAGIFKALLLFLVLVAQPIGLGVLVLAALDRLFQHVLVATLQRRGYLSLDRYTSGDKPQSQDDLRHRASALPDSLPPNAAAPGETAVAAYEEISVFGYHRSLAERVLAILFFRGSLGQFLMALLAVVATTLFAIRAEFLLASLAQAVLASILFGPTLFVYLVLLSRFVIVTEVSTHQTLLDATALDTNHWRRELRRPWLTRRARARYGTSLFLLGLSGSLRAHWRLLHDSALRQQVRATILEAKNHAEMANLPSLAVTLSILAEYRDGVVTLRSNPRVYALYARSRVARYLSRRSRIC